MKHLFKSYFIPQNMPITIDCSVYPKIRLYRNAQILCKELFDTISNISKLTCYRVQFHIFWVLLLGVNNRALSCLIQSVC